MTLRLGQYAIVRFWKAAALLIAFTSLFALAMLPGAAFAEAASTSAPTSVQVLQATRLTGVADLGTMSLETQDLNPSELAQCPEGATKSGTFDSNPDCWWAYFAEVTEVPEHTTTYAAGTLLIGTNASHDRVVTEHANLKESGDGVEWDGGTLPWIKAGVEPTSIRSVISLGMIRPVNLVWRNKQVQGSRNCVSWFSDVYGRLESFDGRGIDVAGCSSLSWLLASAGAGLDAGKTLKVDVSGWNTAFISDFSYAFNGCSKLASLDISSWNMLNTSGQTGCTGMLGGCPSLKTVKLHRRSVLQDSHLPSHSETGVWVASTENGDTGVTDKCTTEQLIRLYPLGGSSYGAATWTWTEQETSITIGTITYRSNGHGLVRESLTAAGKAVFYDVLKPSGTPSGAWALPDQGYHFVGWRCDLANTPFVETNVHLAQETVSSYAKQPDKYASATFTAVFEPNVYRIVYNENGGTWSNPIQQQTMTYDKAANLIIVTGNLTRSGYTFAGWNSTATGLGASYRDGQSVSNLTSQNYGDKASPYGEVHLYAQWTAIPVEQQTTVENEIKDTSSTKESSTKESSTSKTSNTTASTVSTTPTVPVSPIATNVTPTTPATTATTNTNTSTTTRTSAESTSRNSASGSNDSALNVTPVSSSPIVTQGAGGSAGTQSARQDATSGQGEGLAEEFVNMSSAQKARVVSNAVTTVATVSVFAGGASILGVAGTAGASGVADLAAELAAESAAVGGLFGRRRRKKEEEIIEAGEGPAVEG